MTVDELKTELTHLLQAYTAEHHKASVSAFVLNVFSVESDTDDVHHEIIGAGDQLLSVEQTYHWSIEALGAHLVRMLREQQQLEATMRTAPKA